ncbi:hypothetical protein CC77DRAFT_49656 [Alternaria alternata]|uniref:Uncharacterized protein n=1 Tax=Alternaria alternata TaxID=5599 RepID=A0A177E3U0_ALTAL|nr:hypothetical protein CC77DRAFT_49656 [Alternaria alternata]OAG26448.1 hypothetical protein CC77DRAFT_49656 [Alternaria alternata]
MHLRYIRPHLYTPVKIPQSARIPTRRLKARRALPSLIPIILILAMSTTFSSPVPTSQGGRRHRLPWLHGLRGLRNRQTHGIEDIRGDVCWAPLPYWIHTKSNNL